MRYLLALLLLPFFTSAQLKGSYWVSSKENYESFTFKRNGEFSHETGSHFFCFRRTSGHGLYRILSDTLVIMFERGTSEHDDTLSTILVSDCLTDSILIDVRVYDAISFKPVSFTYVSLYSLFVGGSADQFGHFTFRVKKSDANDLLLIHLSNYAFQRIPIKLNKNYSIISYLTMEEPKNYEGWHGEIRKYLMHRVGNKKIQLKELDSKGDFVTFKKVKTQKD